LPPSSFHQRSKTENNDETAIRRAQIKRMLLEYLISFSFSPRLLSRERLFSDYCFVPSHPSERVFMLLLCTTRGE
jgi:hypothetical protein